MIIKVLSSILVIIIAFLLQTTFFRAIALADVVPNLMLIVTVSYGYIRGRTHGMWIGLISGLMFDMMYESIIGLCGFSLMTIGFFIGYVKKIFFTDSILLPIVLMSMGDFAYCIYYYVTEFLLRGRLNFIFYFIHVILPELLYTIPVGIGVFYLIRLLDERIDRGIWRKEDDINV